MTTKQIYKALYDDIRENGDRVIGDESIQVFESVFVKFTVIDNSGSGSGTVSPGPEDSEPAAVSSKVKEAVDHGISKMDESKMPKKKNYNQTAEVKEAKKDAKK